MKSALPLNSQPSSGVSTVAGSQPQTPSHRRSRMASDAELQICQEKGRELLQIKSVLDVRRESLRTELFEISEKLAQTLKVRERLKSEVAIQREKKEAALMEYQLRAERAEAVMSGGAVVVSQSLQFLLNERQEHTSELLRTLVAAERQTAVLDHIVMTQAKTLSKKQQRLCEARDTACRLHEVCESLQSKLELIKTNLTHLDREITDKAGEVATVQLNNNIARSQVATVELAVKRQKELTAAKQAMVDAIKKEIDEKRERLADTQRHVAQSRELADAQQVRIARLALAENEMQERVKLKLESEAKWKKLHFTEMKTIVETMNSVKEREERLVIARREGVQSRSVCQ